MFRGVVEGHSWDGEEKFPSVGGLFVVVVVGVVDDVVADLSEEVGEECVTLWRDGFGRGCVGQDVVPWCVVEVGEGRELVGADVMCRCVGLVRVGGCG